jgi:D-glycero-D-manno-heptose 1,7-bisphosphate phosphatase
MMRRAVFLDRDGVINRAVLRNGKSYPPSNLSEFVYLPGVQSSIRELRRAGYLIIVVTNQPDVSSRIQSENVINLMHQKIFKDGLCDDVKVCFHLDSDCCSCRKPKPGMLIEAANKWQIDLADSFMVGDRWRDIGAGKAAGCFTYFIDYQYEEQRPLDPDLVVKSLEEAAKHILYQI